MVATEEVGLEVYLKGNLLILFNCVPRASKVRLLTFFHSGFRFERTNILMCPVATSLQCAVHVALRGCSLFCARVCCE